MTLAGRATAAGTARYAARQVAEPQVAEPRVAEPKVAEQPVMGGPPPDALEGPVVQRGHFRQALGLTVSSIGYGTSGGESSDEVDAAYCLAVEGAVRYGCNHLDTAASYRAQRSEIALGRAIAALVRGGICRRDELIVTSKAGFIAYRLQQPANPSQYVFDTFVRTGIADPDDLAGGIHCMAPNFLGQQVAWSLRNLGLRCLDVYYLQNPEVQLAFVDRMTFRKRLQLAFAALEEEVASGRIGCYGVATWDGPRRAPVSPGYMSLEVLVGLAAEVAGPDHHLRVIQLPISVAMPEAQTLRNQPVQSSILSVLKAAHSLGLGVVGSAALGQGALTDRHALVLRDTFPELAGSAPRALQFARSLPGVASVLFGSLQPAHIRENLAVAAIAPDPERALRLAQSLAR